jgi:hypothetical protein
MGSNFAATAQPLLTPSIKKPQMRFCLALESRLQHRLSMLKSFSLVALCLGTSVCLATTCGAARMPSGPYAGQCLDTHDKRVAVISKDDGREMTVTNLYHAHRFWTATINWSAITSVRIEFERFAAPFAIVAAHTQLRFDSSQGIVLQAGKASQTIRSFVVTYEYTAPPGIPFDIVAGEFNNFGIVGRMVSSASRHQEERGDPLQSYRLRLSSSAAAQVARMAIYRSQQLGYATMYNTLSENCTTEIFVVLDQALHYRGAPLQLGFPLNDPVVQPSLQALRSRGLL